MKNRISILSFCLFLIAFFSKAQVNFQWATGIGGSSSNDVGNSVAVDAFGNVYTTGWFCGTVDFDPGAGVFNLISAGGTPDIFISKLDAFGSFVWAKRMGESIGLSDNGVSIALDAAGNVYTTGFFRFTVDFDPGIGVFNLTSSGGTEDVFVSKLDASGNFVWAKRIGGAAGDNGYEITVDASGNTYLTGTFMGTCDFDPGAGIYNLTSAGIYDIFLSKLDPSGNFIWANRIGKTGIDGGYSIVIDRLNNVYATGYFQDTVDFDPGSGVYNLISASAGFTDVFVTKFNTSGNFVWAKNMGSTSGDVGYSIAVDTLGHVYTTGYFNGTSDFDPGPSIYTLSSTGSNEIFICKLDTAGTFVWAKSIGGTGIDYGQSVSVDLAGNVYATGFFSAVSDFDPGAGVYNLTSSGGEDIFINKLDASGNFVWAKSMGGPSAGDVGWCVYVDPLGSIYSTGHFYSPVIDFDPGSGVYNIASAGNSDAYIHKMSQSPLEIKNLFYNSESIKIFPNPNTGNFKLILQDSIKNGELTLINSLGQEIYKRYIAIGVNEINIGSLAKGLYNYILFQDNQKIKSDKLIIE